ncbi:phosphate ABC transporter substrate-binding protein [Spiroplasma sp. BIUS-1]|uniref:phosphate ABC transporter substrate-binding protein n=1 Tax=Spiroplasma sp. BIUS-1 TaxID=216964 RepID=UPI001397A25C|nr:phosphate ABC transporter substrate-binding protein [Spiroplasma sp. BIUS-1]QHX36908.1 phosphate ABC transporter substrate-binding protein [Spiroplasma sp. BIUS-1]
MSKKISIILLIFLSVILGLWIWSAAVPKNSIILGGSTSVNPFMQKLTKEYHDETKVDFVYNSTGSQAGVSGVEKDMYSAGFISKDINEGTLTKGNTFFSDFKPKSQYADSCKTQGSIKEYDFDKVEEPHSGESRDKSYVALEFAIDAIGIIYNSPSYWGQEIKYGENKVLTLNDLMNFDLENGSGKKMISDIYSGSKNWEDIAYELIIQNKSLDEATKNDFINLINSQAKQKIVTYTREDGSGTRSAFSDLTGVKNMPNSNVVNSNGSMIENMQRAPSVGYVSNAFLKQLTTDGPINLAGIDDYKLPIGEEEKPFEFIDNEWVEIEGKNVDEFIRDTYTFKRPFITIFNTHSDKYDELMKLFDFINSEKSDNVFKSEGLVKNMKYKTIIGGTYA